MRPHVCHVGILGNLTAGTLCIGTAYQVVVVTAIDIECQGNAVLEAEVKGRQEFFVMKMASALVTHDGPVSAVSE